MGEGLNRPQHIWWEVRYGNIRFPIHKVEVVAAFKTHLLLFEDREGNRGPFKTAYLLKDPDGDPKYSYHQTWEDAKQALCKACQDRVLRAKRSADWWEDRRDKARAMTRERYLMDLLE